MVTSHRVNPPLSSWRRVDHPFSKPILGEEVTASWVGKLSGCADDLDHRLNTTWLRNAHHHRTTLGTVIWQSTIDKCLEVRPISIIAVTEISQVSGRKGLEL